MTALRDASSVRVELEAVTFIDSAGKAVLRRMREEGAVLFASGCMTRAILEEIETGRRERLLPRARLMILPGGHGDYLGELTAEQKGSRYPELTAGLIEAFLDAPAAD